MATIVKSECKHHGVVEFYHYIRNGRNDYRCAVCLREKRKERYKKNKKKEREWVVKWSEKNKERIKELCKANHDRRRDEIYKNKLFLVEKYEPTILKLYKIFKTDYDKEKLIKRLFSDTTQLNIINRVVNILKTGYKSIINRRLSWQVSHLVKYHHGLIDIKNGTSTSNYENASERLKNKIRKETKEYVEIQLDATIKPLIETVDKVDIEIKDIKVENKQEEVIPFIPKKDRKIFTISNIVENKLESVFLNKSHLTNDEVIDVQKLIKNNYMTFLIEKRAKINSENRKKSPIKMLGVKEISRIGKRKKISYSYVVHISLNRKKEYLGMYKSKEEASDVYDKRMIKHYGFELANMLNLLNNPKKFKQEKVIYQKPTQKLKGVQTRVKAGKTLYIVRFKFKGVEYYKSFNDSISAAQHYNKKMCELYGSVEAKKKNLLNKIKKA